MKYSRTIGMSRRDKIKNTEIRRKLNLQPVQQLIEEARTHVMDSNRQIKRVWEAKTTGKNRKSRPTKTWNKLEANLGRKQQRKQRTRKTGEASSMRNSTQTQYQTWTPNGRRGWIMHVCLFFGLYRRLLTTLEKQVPRIVSYLHTKAIMVY